MKTDIEERRRNYFRDRPDRTLFFFALIAAAVWTGILHGNKPLEADDYWTETRGVIESSEVAVSMGHKLYKTAWDLKISYTYELDGETFSGYQYSLGGNLSSAYREEIAEIVGRYPEGTAVKVYYDPENPKNAVLVK